MTMTRAYAAAHAGAAIAPHTIERREPGPHDIAFDVMYCGICHTDIHMTRGEVPGSLFPMVPGHEIIGRVTRVGAAVRNHAVGDVIGVGCFVDSCRSCPDCDGGEEHFCRELVTTYNCLERDGVTPTYGGYSSNMTVHERYALKVSPKLDPAAAAPLLCAGITTYSPLRYWDAGPGKRVGVIGLGGLGHIAVKLAAAMGCEVTVFSTSEAKRADATRLGAHDFANTKTPGELKRLANHFDIILSTVSAGIEGDAYINTLKRDGVLVMLGVPDAPMSVNTVALMTRRKHLSGSLIGGIPETQEMLDFCAEHGIGCDIELIGIEQVNNAYARILSSDVRYRFVIDMATLNRPAR